MRRSPPLLFLLLLALDLPAQEAKKPLVAILPFTSHVLDTGAIDGLVSAMGSELINTGAFRVMERSQMEEILKEQGFQQSGACDGQECAVEVGKLLSVNQMVLGTIAKVGSTYTLTARLVSVQTGEVLKSVTRNSKTDVDAILTDLLPQVAEVLAGASKPEPAATTTPAVATPVATAAPLAVQNPPAIVSDHPTETSTRPSATPTETPVVVERKQGSHWGWWLAGGALVAAGATAAVLLLNGDSSSNPSATTTTVHASW